MKNKYKNRRKAIVQKKVSPDDVINPDEGGNKTGTDTDSDKTKTKKTGNGKSPDRFDKPKREVDPDRTGIDTQSGDKHKK